MHETSDFFLLYNNLSIYQVLCTLIYRRRSLYSFLFVCSKEVTETTDFILDTLSEEEHNGMYWLSRPVVVSALAVS